MELISAARQRESQREQERIKAARAVEMQTFTKYLHEVFGEGFVEQAGGSIQHDGTPHVRMQYSGDTYRLYRRRNPDASSTWMVNERELFIHGRHPEQQEAIDLAALAIAQLAESEPEPEQPQPTPETVRLEEPAEESL
jgi:hypothetical protein